MALEITKQNNYIEITKPDGSCITAPLCDVTIAKGKFENTFDILVGGECVVNDTEVVGCITIDGAPVTLAEWEDWYTSCTGCVGGASEPVEYTFNKESYCADLNGDGSEYGYVNELQKIDISDLSVVLSIKKDETGTIRPNAVITDDCNCPCKECVIELVTCAVFRQDYFDLSDLVSDSMFPLQWNVTGADGNGNLINLSVSTPFNATWTDNTNIYDDLINSLNTISGVEATAVFLTGYNGDGAPDIEIKISENVTVTIDRLYTGAGDYLTILESGGNTTVTAGDDNGIFESPLWHECVTGDEIGSNNTFSNNL